MARLQFLAGFAALLSFGGAVPCHAQASPVAAAAPDPEKLAIAQDIIRIGFPPETRREMLTRTSDAMMAQMREGILNASGMSANSALQRIFDRYLGRLRTVSNESFSDGLPAIFDAMARAYARLFSRDELLQIRTFVSTPAGARFFQQSAEILSDPDVVAANRAHMERTLAALRPLMDELRREMDAEVARHPPR